MDAQRFIIWKAHIANKNDIIQWPVWSTIENKTKQKRFRRRKTKWNSLNSALLFLMHRVRSTLHSSETRIQWI